MVSIEGVWARTQERTWIPAATCGTKQTERRQGAHKIALRRMLGSGFSAWLFLVALLHAPDARADEVTVLAAHDTTLYAENGALANGQGGGLFVGLNGRHEARRTLLAFDVAQALPSGTTILSATLTLQMSRGQAPVSEIELHRVTSEWGEGASQARGQEGGGGVANDGDATWSHRSWPDETWDQEGGDFVSAPSASQEVRDVGTYSWTSEQLTTDVQDFLEHPEDNFGWILIGETATRDASKRFNSRENSAAVPRLVISYEPPKDPAGACCLRDGSCGVSLDPGDTCQGDYLGTGSRCEPDACPEPLGACCLLDSEGGCELRTRSDCGDDTFQGVATSCSEDLCPVILTPFVDALPVPEAATPIMSTEGTAEYRIELVQLKQQFHGDLPSTTVWGFDDGNVGGSPGPTIEARVGEPVSVVWANALRDEDDELLSAHPLEVDTCLHGADNDQPRTVVHLHGGHVPAGYDGQPEATLLPGEEVRYEYPNRQRAATLWYHDHAVGITRLNVYMGLAGFYVLRDADEEALNLPSGPYEVPLAIQDRSFYPDGRLRYPATWQDSFFGDNAVVNGKVSPYFEVARGKYRFRLLNGSTSRAYTLSLSDGRAFLQIGNDGGLLSESISTRNVTILPGERADVIIDFEDAESEVVLRNTAKSPYPYGGVKAAALHEIMKFVVTDEEGYTDPIPVQLSSFDEPDESDAVLTRDLVMSRAVHEHCGYAMWLINDKEWDDITERPQLGTSEVWRFVNPSGLTHPMHMHSLFFRVLDRQPFVMNEDTMELQGKPAHPRRAEQGFKDTVQVGPFEVVRVLARFEDYAGRFPYHCHLIEHEDHGMMRQFEVLNECGDGARALDEEECDDGNTDDGDGCDADCRNEGGGPGGDAGEDAGDKPKDSGCSLASLPEPRSSPPRAVVVLLLVGAWLAHTRCRT